ncbi:MAG: hypothetical protein ABIR51_06685 [Sphingomicrobium sp.]
MTFARAVAALSFVLVAGVAHAAPPAHIVAAEGAWAALSRGAICEAASVALLPATRDRALGRASLAFDVFPGGRRGQLAIRLSRPAQPGSSAMLTIGDQPFLLTARGDLAWSRGPGQEAAIIQALRGGGGMRVAARAQGGGRIVDRYDLAGAATAIDAAAACAANMLANR